MRTALLKTVFLAAAATAMALPASAGETFANSDFTNGLSAVSAKDAKYMERCLDTDPNSDANSSAIHACTRALRASTPNFETRSTLLTRRGLLHFANADFDKASSDFRSASKLSKDNQLASLGEGFSMLMDGQHEDALRYFNDCKNHHVAAPLAAYGSAMAKELLGDAEGAYADYNRALDLRPGWEAPQIALERFEVKSAG